MTEPPRRRMAAHALVRDGDGRVLLVEPTYGDTWLLPGGAVERDESPRAACARELTEELGLHVALGRLLVLEWVGPRPALSEGLMLVYDGGEQADGTALVLPPAELSAHRFVEPDDVARLADEEVTGRVAAAVAALRTGAVVELEDGARR